jgi:hypothetical protein
MPEMTAAASFFTPFAHQEKCSFASPSVKGYYYFDKEVGH